MSIILKSGSSGNLANIDALGNLQTLSSPAALVQTATAWTSGTALNTTQALLTTGGYPAIVLQLNQGSTITAGAVTFEGTYDGINWATIPTSQVLNPNTFAQLTNPYTLVASTNQSFLILVQGYQQVRYRLSTAILGSGTLTPYWTLQSASPIASVSGGGTGTVSVTGIVQVAPTTSANTRTNPFFTEITDGTSTMGAMASFGSNPGAVPALNANVAIQQGTVAVTGTSTVAVAGTSTVEVAGILGTSTVTIAGTVSAACTGTQTVTVVGTSTVTIAGTVTAACTGTQTVTVVGTSTVAAVGTSTVTVAAIAGTPTVEV